MSKNHNKFRKENILIKIKLSIAILLLIFGINIVYSNPLNSYEYLKLEFKTDIEFKLNFENRYEFENFYLNSYFFPQNKEENLFINEFESSKENYNLLEDFGNNYIQFSYNKNSLLNQNNINNKFLIESLMHWPKIKEKENFPILNPNNNEYLEFIGLIDTNQKIKNQASQLAQGQDDVFLIASIIAKWIREDINYDLSTIAENPNQKSSEVFESKVGVCKEITNLYVSMMRSLGIPARVVSGFAYTDSQEVVDFVGNNWGGHAWAEVYISGEWVPFDLTYNQYGFVDATHIPTFKGLEVKSQSASISSKGFGFSLVSNSLKANYNFTVIDKKNINEDIPFKVEISGPQELAQNSFGHIELNVKNTQDYYQVVFLNLAKANEIELLDLNHKMVILKPNDEKKVFFRYKIPDLDKNYIYTMPFKIYNELFEEEFSVEVKSTNQLIEQIDVPQDEQIKVEYSSNNPKLSCSFIIEVKENLLLCSIQNQNNYELNNFQVCSSKTCEVISLKINEQQTITFNTKEFKENIFYQFEDKKYEFNFEIKKPKINYLLNVSNQRGELNTTIENFQQGLVLNIYNNEKLVFSSMKKEDRKTLILLAGEHNLRGELILGNTILDEFEASFETKKPTVIEQIKNFFTKLINSFKIIFFN